MTLDAIHIPCALAAVVAAVLGCGCGKGAQMSDAGVWQPTPADRAFIADFCAAITPCCATDPRSDDTAACEQSLTELGMSRDSQVRSACLDELRQRASGGACMPDIGDLGGPCSRLFDEPSGPRAPGEACASNAECAGSPGTITLCVLSHCITYAVGALGDYPCLGDLNTAGLTTLTAVPNGGTSPVSNGFVCQQRAGLYCDGIDNRCKQVLPGGSACTINVGCDSWLCANGTCRPLPNMGEACTFDCKGDNYCDATAVCAPRLAEGAACSGDAQCSGTCGGSYMCFGSCVQGVCSPNNVAQVLRLGVWCGSAPVSG